MKTYGLLYLELLDKYGKGAQETGMVTTIFGITVILSCKFNLEGYRNKWPKSLFSQLKVKGSP